MHETLDAVPYQADILRFWVTALRTWTFERSQERLLTLSPSSSSLVSSPNTRFRVCRTRA